MESRNEEGTEVLIKGWLIPHLRPALPDARSRPIDTSRSRRCTVVHCRGGGSLNKAANYDGGYGYLYQLWIKLRALTFLQFSNNNIRVLAASDTAGRLSSHQLCLQLG